MINEAAQLPIKTSPLFSGIAYVDLPHRVVTIYYVPRCKCCQLIMDLSCQQSPKLALTSLSDVIIHTEATMRIAVSRELNSSFAD